MLPSADVILRAVGLGVVVPAAVVVAAALVLRFAGGTAVAVLAGLFAGFAALAASGQIGWGFLKADATDPRDILPALALLAVVVSPWRQIAFISVWARPVSCLGLAVLTSWLVGRAEAAVEPLSPWWYAAIAGAVVALWGLLDIAAARRPGFLLPALLALTVFGAAALCELSNNSTLAQLGGVPAAVLLGCAVVAWWRAARPSPIDPGLETVLPARLVPTDVPITRAAVPAVAVMLPGLLFLSYRNSFDSVPPASYLLLLAAPLCLGATGLLQLGPSPWRRAAILGAVTGIPLAAALALAARA